MTTCTHTDQIRDVFSAADGYVGCALGIGDTWVHLRMCMSYGTCSAAAIPPRRTSARQSIQAESHPIVQSFEPGEDWYWCYVSEVAFIMEGAPPSATRRGQPTK